MSEATLEAYIRQLLESHRTPQVTVAWQGGEPTLMGLEFFKRSVELVEQYRRPGQDVQHTFQTNGILLDDEWCAFFKEHNFLVGLSVDGPRELHDAYRRRSRRTRHLRSGDARLAASAPARGRLQHPVHRQRRQPGSTAARSIASSATSSAPSGCSSSRSSSAPPPRRSPIANLGWGDRPGSKRLLYTQTGQPGHGALGRRRAVRPLPRGRLRGMGAPRRRSGLRAALRRDARGVFRPPPAVHPRADLRLRPGARAQRRPLLLRSLRRAAATCWATSTRRTC